MQKQIPGNKCTSHQLPVKNVETNYELYCMDLMQTIDVIKETNTMIIYMMLYRNEYTITNNTNFSDIQSIFLLNESSQVNDQPTNDQKVL